MTGALIVPRPDPPRVMARYLDFCSPHVRHTIALLVVSTNASPKPIINRTTSERTKNSKPLFVGKKASIASAD